MGTAGTSHLHARPWVEAGIQLGTLQGMESGIRKTNASFKHRAKSRAKPPECPLGVSEIVLIRKEVWKYTMPGVVQLQRCPRLQWETTFTPSKKKQALVGQRNLCVLSPCTERCFHSAQEGIDGKQGCWLRTKLF